MRTGLASRVTVTAGREVDSLNRKKYNLRSAMSSGHTTASLYADNELAEESSVVWVEKSLPAGEQHSDGSTTPPIDVTIFYRPSLPGSWVLSLILIA